MSQRAGLARQQFLAGPRCRRFDLRHGEGDGRAGQSGGRLQHRRRRRADVADARRRAWRHEHVLFGHILPATSSTFNANVSDGAGLGLKGGGTVTTAGTPALALDFNGKVPFCFLAAKLAAQGLSLTGTANVNVQVRGPATSPVIGGTVSTSGARLVDARSGPCGQRHRRRRLDRQRRRQDQPADRHAVDARQPVGQRHGRHQSGARFSGRPVDQARRWPLHRRPRGDRQSRRRPDHQGAARFGAGDRRHRQPGQDRHHRSRQAAGLAGGARRQAQERAGAGARRRTRRCARRATSGRVAAAAWRSTSRSTRRTRSSSRAGASTPNSAARCG